MDRATTNNTQKGNEMENNTLTHNDLLSNMSVKNLRALRSNATDQKNKGNYGRVCSINCEIMEVVNEIYRETGVDFSDYNFWADEKPYDAEKDFDMFFSNMGGS
jgi:hypothetical protein